MQVRDINTYIRREMFGINTQSCSQATRPLSSKPGRLLLLLCNCRVFADSLKSSKWWRKLREDLSFHCFTNWHRATHSPFFHSLFLTLFLCFFSTASSLFSFWGPNNSFPQFWTPSSYSVNDSIPTLCQKLFLLFRDVPKPASWDK